MKYYVIAGETSGDLHASNLILALKKLDSNAQFRAWGGDKMHQVGTTIVKHVKDLAIMGFWEVLINLGTILKNFRFCKRDILYYQPDAIIYVDYPGFNLRMVKWAKKNGFRNYYYISPQIWAWKESRIETIKRYIDRLYVILPFEKDYYKRKHSLDVEYVGHPLTDIIPIIKETLQIKNRPLIKQSSPIVALLPGSRFQEIKRLLPLFVEVANRNPQWDFKIATVSTVGIDFYQKFIANSSVQLIKGATYELLSVARGALVTSGTATLETALFDVPQVVCYKTSMISYLMGKLLIRVPYISLVNLILDRIFVKELIQKKCSTLNLEKELHSIMSDQMLEDIKNGYLELKKALGVGGASDGVAKSLYHDLNNGQVI